MPNKTSISWTDRTSNPIYAVVDQPIHRAADRRGWFCTKISEGCQNCYSEKLNMRFGNRLAFTEANRERVEWRLNERELDAILRLRKPQRIFIGDMGDLFHEDVPQEFVIRVFTAMRQASQHTFQVLTKRPERMRNEVRWMETMSLGASWEWPLPNVWLGVSVENQARADERIPILLETPAAVRFVSAEPLLGPIDLTGNRWEDAEHCYLNEPMHGEGGLDWVIVGAESGGPPERRLVEKRWCIGPDVAGRCGRNTCKGHWHPKPEALGWVRSIRDQCQAAGVPFFLKQLGPKAGQGTEVDGRVWQEMPEVRA